MSALSTSQFGGPGCPECGGSGSVNPAYAMRGPTYEHDVESPDCHVYTWNGKGRATAVDYHTHGERAAKAEARGGLLGAWRKR